MALKLLPNFVAWLRSLRGTFVQAIQLGWLLFRLDRAHSESAVILSGFPCPGSSALRWPGYRLWSNLKCPIKGLWPGGLEPADQLFEDRRLARLDSFPRLVETEPGRPVDLGKGRLLSGFRRPFHLEGVAGDPLDIKVVL